MVLTKFKIDNIGMDFTHVPNMVHCTMPKHVNNNKSLKQKKTKP